MKTTKIIAAAFLCFLSFGAFAQNLDEIISKHIDAIGGKANWDKVKSLKMEGTTKAQGADIKVTFLQVDKKASKQIIALMGMTGYSIVTNTEGWTFFPFQGQTKPEPMTADDVKNAQEDLYLQDDFLTYKDLGKKIELIGKDDVDGTECFKIKMTDKDAHESTYYIDPSNYYVIKQTDKIKANGQEMEVSSSFGNYKKLDEGIVYPMSVTGGFGDMEVSSVIINPTIDDSEFKLPK